MPGVYISYPFCAQKCSFCNFASGVAAIDVTDRYGRVLLDEIRSHEWHFAPETIYWGGGTPSLMPADLLGACTKAMPREQITEATLECAPGTITRERVAVWKACGINRVSLGVQSFVTGELRQVGRRHTAEVVARDVALLRAEGIDNINLDLIAGLPGQTSQSWNDSLEWMERLAAPHASVYLFEVDEESRLGKELIFGGSRYGAEGVPTDDLCADFYEMAVERLTLMGVARYEISNFAQPGFESRHNLKYWRLEPYVGFGLDAHSFDGRYRWGNADTLNTYFLEREKAGAAASERTQANAAEERFFVGLRLSHGIILSAQDWAQFASPIAKWVEAGMLERVGDRLRLSNRGYLVSNEIFQEFVHAS